MCIIGIQQQREEEQKKFNKMLGLVHIFVRHNMLRSSAHIQIHKTFWLLISPCSCMRIVYFRYNIITAFCVYISFCSLKMLLGPFNHYSFNNNYNTHFHRIQDNYWHKTIHFQIKQNACLRFSSVVEMNLAQKSIQ